MERPVRFAAMFGNGSLKQALAELFRGGCRVDVVAHDPPAIGFRTPDGAACRLFVDRDWVVLARGDETARYPSLNAALRAAAV